MTSHIDASGVVRVLQMTDRTWRDVVAGQELSTQARFQITGSGAGTIRAGVQVIDQSGQLLYARNTTIYVLATEQDIFTGTEGPSALQRAYIEHARTAGSLTQEQYEAALEQLLYGGATEASTLVVPTAAP